MTATQESKDHPPGPWVARLRRSRLVLAAGALAFAILWLASGLPPVLALIGFTVIAAAALLAAGPDMTEHKVLPSDQVSGRRVGEPMVEAILAALPDPAIALDRNGSVIAFNSRTNSVAAALRRGDPVTLGLRVPEVLDAIRQAQASGTAQRAEFSERVPVDRWHEVIVAPITVAGAGGTSGLLLVIFRDLTPLRHVEEMRADFVANASHELRTPLAALTGFIETLRGPAREDTAARERFLGIMAGQARRMARLIDDLLSLSRIELNEHRRPGTQVDLVGILRQVVDGLQVLARDRDVAVNMVVPAGPIPVHGDRDELLRVFENLIENALKYAASGKRLDITLMPGDGPKGELRAAVRDYGPGIAPEHLPRLTERFYRVDVADSRAQGGTGLGLALVKHILNRHGGRLTIESTPGKGATFTALLPPAPPEGRQK